MNGKATKMASGTRRSLGGTTEIRKMDAMYMNAVTTYATMYSTTPTLLVELTLNVPSGWVLLDVPPAIHRISPMVIRSWMTRKCLVVNFALDFALTKSKLWIC
jgi:hypothetical protein